MAAIVCLSCMLEVPPLFSHKWLCAPKSAGFLCYNSPNDVDRLVERLTRLL